MHFSTNLLEPKNQTNDYTRIIIQEYGDGRINLLQKNKKTK